jgi:hypothetical protein
MIPARRAEAPGLWMNGTGAVAAGCLFMALGASYFRIGATFGMVFLLGTIAKPRISRSSTP